MAGTELVPGPTACQLDVRGKLAGLGVPLALLLGALLLMAGVPGPVLGPVVAVLAGAAAVASIAFTTASGAVIKRERAAGYSTMYDFPGYELRDPRTLELLRAADVKPTGTMRRSLFRAMLTVKPGTLVAKRLAEEEDEDR
jgi:hypothetical protein